MCVCVCVCVCVCAVVVVVVVVVFVVVLVLGDFLFFIFGGAVIVFMHAVACQPIKKPGER